MPVEGAVADILVAAEADTAVVAAAACTVGFAASLSSALAVVAAGMDKVHIRPVLDTEIEVMAVQSQLP